MSDQKDILVGSIEVGVGGQTEAEYRFVAKCEVRCVVTELYAEWSPSTSDEDIKAFLYDPKKKLGLPPTPNYQMAYGPNAGSVCPLMMIFDLKNPRLRFTNSQFDPIKDPMPLWSPDKPFEIDLRGTPITVGSDFGLRFSIKTRPFNS